MIFDTIIQPKVSINECVIVEVFDGKQIQKMYGFVSKIEKDYIWLKPTKDSDQEPIRFNLKLDKILKMN